MNENAVVALEDCPLSCAVCSDLRSATVDKICAGESLSLFFFFVADLMRNHRIARPRVFHEAMRRLRNFIPFEEWPVRTQSLMLRSTTLTHVERFQLATFLLGNGVAVDDVRLLLAHRLRDKSAELHVASIAKEYASGTHDRRRYYYNVMQRDYLFYDGTPHHERAGDGRELNEQSLRTWRDVVARRRP